MINNWLTAFQDLDSFVSQHHEISLSPDRISVPEETRRDFWQRFDYIGEAFLADKFPALCRDALSLCTAYRHLEYEVMQSCGLESVSVPFYLRDFFHDPLKSDANSGLFDLVMNLAKGKLTPDAFEKEASVEVSHSLVRLCRMAYEKWTVLALIKILGARRLYGVSVPEIESHERHQTPLFKDHPVPIETPHLTLQHDPLTVVMAPDFIARTENGDFVAVKSNVQSFGDFSRAIVNEVKDREYIANKNILRMEPAVTLIYTAPQAQDIALLAGTNKIMRPDLVIEYRLEAEWRDAGGLAEVYMHHDVLRPKLGTFVVSREPATDMVAEREIQVIGADLDHARLQPILDRINSSTRAKC